MKKFITLILLSGFIFCFNLHYALSKGLIIDQTPQGQEKKKISRHNQKESDNTSGELQSKELKKKKIESDEHSINKNKRVKRFSSDKEIPETVKKRNIP